MKGKLAIERSRSHLAKLTAWAIANFDFQWADAQFSDDGHRPRAPRALAAAAPGRLATRTPAPRGAVVDTPPSWPQRLAFAAVLLFSLTIASNWTQDVPARYGMRHAGLAHSALYPQIDTAPRR